MNRRIKLFTLFSILATLLLVGCGGTTTTPASTPTTGSTPTGGITTTTVNLKHLPNGTATLSWDPASHALTVTLKLSGLAPGPNSIHPAYIYEGSCRNQGKMLYQLKNNVEADTHGNATVTSPISNVPNGIPATGWSVTVYNGPGSSADDHLQIVCGDVANPKAVTTAAQSVQVPFNEAPPSSVGQSATGTAQLTVSGGSLTVKLTVSGLAPNSTHAAHIHLGSCASQGPIEHALMALTANASGNASGTTTIPNVSAIPKSGWYVNVHRGSPTELSTSIGFDPIACGDVTPG